MNHYYYAAYAKAPRCVAIFPTRMGRDEWVSYRDEMSRLVCEEEDKANDPRIALTPEQAYLCVGSRLYDKAKQIMDEFMENVRWAYDSSLDRRARA